MAGSSAGRSRHHRQAAGAFARGGRAPISWHRRVRAARSPARHALYQVPAQPLSALGHPQSRHRQGREDARRASHPDLPQRAQEQSAADRADAAGRDRRDGGGGDRRPGRGRGRGHRGRLSRPAVSSRSRRRRIRRRAGHPRGQGQPAPDAAQQSQLSSAARARRWQHGDIDKGFAESDIVREFTYYFGGGRIVPMQPFSGVCHLGGRQAHLLGTRPGHLSSRAVPGQLARHRQEPIHFINKWNGGTFGGFGVRTAPFWGLGGAYRQGHRAAGQDDADQGRGALPHPAQAGDALQVQGRASPRKAGSTPCATNST